MKQETADGDERNIGQTGTPSRFIYPQSPLSEYRTRVSTNRRVSLTNDELLRGAIDTTGNTALRTWIDQDLHA